MIIDSLISLLKCVRPVHGEISLSLGRHCSPACSGMRALGGCKTPPLSGMTRLKDDDKILQDMVALRLLKASDGLRGRVT